MTVYPLTSKSLDAIKAKGFMKIYEGAVRSAKTVTSLVDWYSYVMLSSENVFLMSGATMGSLARNCLDGDFGFIALTGGKAIKRTDTDGSKFLQLGKKKIYYCGSDNKASYKKIRGLTIGGSYSDEMNLHDPDFLDTMFARSFASTDRLILGTLNPDAPGHWLYKKYLDVYRDNKTPGYHWFHFTLDDNPAISEERKAEIRAQYTGVFYQRYVLGLRVRAEGGCYPSFSERNIIDTLPEEPIIFAQIGSDIGGNKSATCYALTGFFVRNKKLCAVLIDEHHDKENKSTETILANFKAFALRGREQYQLADAYTDSAEQLIKKSMQNLGVVNVHDSLKKPIIDRIRFEDLMFSQCRLFIMRHCTHTIEAVQSAVYNPKSDREERLDDGTVNIDSLDAFEYSFENRMKEFGI